jgi:NADP-dependent 3-hydroxy acid dehydrogenase YdfG
METRDIAGTVVAVTGATSGIGAATVAGLVKAGANVVATGRREERLRELQEVLGVDQLEVLAGDVRDPDTSRRLAAAAVNRWERLDSVVLSAGVGAYGGILDGTDDQLADMIAANLNSTIWGVRAAVPHMLAGGGDIVIVASVAGLRGGANEAVYAATKFGQLGLAGAVDRELRTQGIRVTAICPAAVATEFAMGAGRTPDTPELANWMQADDVAAAILYTLSQPRRLRTTQWSLWSAAESS